MPLSTSNFKRRLRLPRLFFRKPTKLERVHGGPPLEYERPIPDVPVSAVSGIGLRKKTTCSLKGLYEQRRNA